MSTHWTDADFLNHLYEVGPPVTHLDECEKCRAQWEHYLAARRAVTLPATVQQSFLSGQRLRIEQRINRRSAWPAYIKWSPALALAALVLFVFAWRTPPPRAEHRAASDAQLMSEIYQTLSDPEPRAVEPLRGLFQQGAE